MTASSSTRWSPLYGYSTNVHKTTSLSDVYRFLREYTVPVKKRVFGTSPAGLELHLSMATARELEPRDARRALASYLNEAGLRLFSVNAYPLNPFHARRVKEKVYSPSWTEAERWRWTNAIADITADLLPAGLPGSISTLGGAYRRAEHGPKTFRRLAHGYLQTVSHLARLEEETGKTIVLAAEPEPETTFETARDVISFVEDFLLPAARSARGLADLGPARIEETVRRFFTVNFDTCHFSVLFEDLVGSLRELAAAGISVGKIHVTNALRLPRPFRARVAYQQLRAMHEPRYFHQFCGRSSTRRIAWRDLDLDRLPAKLDRARHPDVDEIRSHYHVPVYLERFHRLHTTRDDTRSALLEIRRTRATRHLVVETYTWPIIAHEDRLVRGIAREFRWMLDVLKRAR